MLVGCLLLWLPDLFSPTTDVLWGEMVVSSVVIKSVCFLLTVTSGWVLSLLFFKLYITRTFGVFTAFVYVFTVSCIPMFHEDVEAHVCVLLYLCFMSSLMGMYKNPHAVRHAYNSGMLLAVLSLLHNAFMWLFPIWILGLILQRAWSLRSFLASVLGILTTCVLTAWVCYFGKIDIRELWTSWSIYQWPEDYVVLCEWLVCGVFFLWCVVLLYMRVFDYSIKSRMVMNVMLLLAVAFFALSLLTGIHTVFVGCSVATCLMFIVQLAHSQYSARFIWVNLTVYGLILAVIYICGLSGYGMA